MDVDPAWPQPSLRGLSCLQLCGQAAAGVVRVLPHCSGYLARFIYGPPPMLPHIAACMHATNNDAQQTLARPATCVGCVMVTMLQTVMPYLVAAHHSFRV